MSTTTASLLMIQEMPQHPLSHQSIEDAAGDPELENLEYISTGVPSVPSTTPAAARVIITILLLSVHQKSYSANISEKGRNRVLQSNQ